MLFSGAIGPLQARTHPRQESQTKYEVPDVILFAFPSNVRLCIRALILIFAYEPPGRLTSIWTAQSVVSSLMFGSDPRPIRVFPFADAPDNCKGIVKYRFWSWRSGRIFVSVCALLRVPVPREGAPLIHVFHEGRLFLLYISPPPLVDISYTSLVGSTPRSAFKEDLLEPLAITYQIRYSSALLLRLGASNCGGLRILIPRSGYISHL